MPDFVTIDELMAIAEKEIPSPFIDRVLTGAGSGETLFRNRRALNKMAVVQRLLMTMDPIDMSADFFGTSLPSPIIVAPMGSLFQLHNDGDVEMARGAGRDGTLSTVRPSKWSIEEVAAGATGPLLRQTNCPHNPTDEHLETLASIQACPEYLGVAITVDGQVPVRLDRFLETRYADDPRSRPAREVPEQRFTWSDIDTVRDVVTVPLGMKSVMHPDDARMAIDHGMDFVWVSNHGGRKLDSTRATIDVLPEIVKAVDGQVPIIVDGGFRSGGDVFKAIALGASLVGIGKIGSCALGVNGADGVARMVQILQEEFKISMALSGHTKVDAITSTAVTTIDY